jgi:hypothetical protein
MVINDVTAKIINEELNKDIHTSICDHKYDGETTIPATCHEAGLMTYTCSKCGDSYTEMIPMLEHQYGEKEYIEPKCEVDGYWTSKCDICGDVKIELDAGSALKHEYVGVETTPATCDKVGLMTYTCKNCGDSYTEEIPKTNHNWVKGETVEPTEDDEGYTVYECSICGEVKHDDITPPLGKCVHEFDIKEKVDATCTEDGYINYVCKLCSFEYSDIINKLGHDFVSESKPVTCEEDGYIRLVCSRCGETETTVIEAIGHDWGDWEETNAATCEVNGVKTRYCKNDPAHEDTDIILALGHNWVASEVIEPTETEAGYTIYECSVCGETKHDDFVLPLEECEHDYKVVEIVAATCTEDGYTKYKCDVCGFEYIDDIVPKLGHAFVESIIPATCTENGSTTITCERCDYKEVKVIQKLGHNYITGTREATCAEDGLSTSICTRCGDTIITVIPATGHDWHIIKIVLPGIGVRGYTEYECAICGETKIDDIVPALSNGNRGDSTYSSNGSAAFIEPVRSSSITKTSGEDETIEDNTKTEGRASENIIEIVEEKTPFAVDIPAINPFADINEDDWFFDDLMYVYEYGLMKGTDDELNTFSPYVESSRGMIITLLYRMAGTPIVRGENPFTDVSENDYYYDAIIWGAVNGIIFGVGNGIYSPDDAITREQLAAIIYRYQQFSGQIPSDVFEKIEFDDWDLIEEYAQAPVNALTMQGLILGKPGNLFDPKGLAIRAEMATVFHRYLSVILAQDDTP